jgi:hypothetical protein
MKMTKTDKEKAATGPPVISTRAQSVQPHRESGRGTNLPSTGGPPLIPVVLVGSSIVGLLLVLVAGGLMILARQWRS